jgi:hypothetical protein
MDVRLIYPAGHFYSPVVDPNDALADAARLWPTPPAPVLGIDFRPDSHRHILDAVFPRFIAEFDYPELGADDETLDHFYVRNSEFSWLDARALFVLMREWQPKRVIEVGSGYSTLLMCDVNRRFLAGTCHVTSIEPFPRPFLHRPELGIELIQTKVQDVPLDTFAQLCAGDILFIDSSHVAKTGSDVNYLFFEVLPRLAPGVRIHVHDIHLPCEYLRDWVIDENRSWNEQYLLRGLLMYSSAFRVVFGCFYAMAMMPDRVKAALNLPSGAAFPGGSFWFERCALESTAPGQ